MEENIGLLASDDRLATLLYTSESSIGKQALSYSQGFEKDIRSIDISKTKLSDTIWHSIAAEMKVSLKELLALDHPDAQEITQADLSEEDWIKTLQHNSALLQRPIAIRGAEIKQIDTPSELLQFFDVDSAGLKKEGLGEKPTIQSETKEDDFV